MDGLLRDVTQALRGLRRHPTFGVAALLTLALGIGATTAVFSVVDGVLLRPLPYRQPERLVQVWPAKNFNVSLARQTGGRLTTVESLAGISGWSVTLLGESSAEQIVAQRVSPSFFDLLGVSPAPGRGFAPEEGTPDRGAVAVLSHGLWRRRFGGDPEIVGRTLRLDAFGVVDVVEVVGVAPPDFRSVATREEPDLWLPLTRRPGLSVEADSTWFVNTVIGRLAPGASHEGADAEIRTVARELRALHPSAIEEEEASMASAIPLRDAVVGDVESSLWLLMGAVGLVLLVGCANVANLLLARGRRRRREAAVREALGAGPGRLLRERLTESAILALLGGTAGIGAAAWALRLMAGTLEAWLPRPDAVGVDLRIAAFGVGASLAAALVAGLAPAVRAAAVDPLEGLRSGSGGGASDRRHLLDRALLAGQLALATLLVASAALLLRSLREIHATDPGFRTEGLTAVTVNMPQSRYPTPGERRAFVRSVESTLAALPDVREVGSIHLLPLTPANWSFPYLAEGHVARPDEPLPSANVRLVTASYFRTAGVRMVRGRAFEEGDGVDDPRVGVINEAMARRLWPGEDPLGKEIRLFGSQPFTVVGVVEDVRQHALTERSRAEYYLPYEQWGWAVTWLFVLVRSPRDAGTLAAQLREAVLSVDPVVPAPEIRAMEEVVAESVARERVVAFLVTGFGLAALLLGVVGVYGVTSYVVGGRLREFGIRLAVGAEPRAIVRDALARGLAPVGAGLAAGLLGALAGGRLLSGFLYGVTPRDPLTLVAVPAIMGCAALAAALGPALRASRVDPVRVLKAE